jgi:hypothetical protein
LRGIRDIGFLRFTIIRIHLNIGLEMWNDWILRCCVNFSTSVNHLRQTINHDQFNVPSYVPAARSRNVHSAHGTTCHAVMLTSSEDSDADLRRQVLLWLLRA